MQQQWPGKGGRGFSSPKLRAENSPGRGLWLTVPPSPASPRCGYRKSQRKMHPSFGKNQEPKGTPSMNEDTKAPSQGNRLRSSCGHRAGTRAHPRGDGGGADTSAAASLSVRAPASAHPGFHPNRQQAPGSRYQPFPQPHSFTLNTLCPPSALSGPMRGFLGNSPQPQRIKKQEPWAPLCSGNGSSLVSPSSQRPFPQVTASTGPLERSALGKGHTMA